MLHSNRWGNFLIDDPLCGGRWWWGRATVMTVKSGELYYFFLIEPSRVSFCFAAQFAQQCSFVSLPHLIEEEINCCISLPFPSPPVLFTPCCCLHRLVKFALSPIVVGWRGRPEQLYPGAGGDNNFDDIFFLLFRCCSAFWHYCKSLLLLVANSSSSSSSTKNVSAIFAAASAFVNCVYHKVAVISHSLLWCFAAVFNSLILLVGSRRRLLCLQILLRN